METIKARNSVNADMKRFDPCAKGSSYMQLTEWANGDGFDADIDGEIFTLSWKQLDALNYLALCLRYGDKEE